MEINFLTVFIAVLSLILLAVPGFLLAKFKMMPEKATEAFSAMVLYGCQPVLVFMSFQKERFNSQIGLNMLLVAIIATIVHFAMAGIVSIIIRKKSKSDKLKVAKYACVFSNCGFMGFPFLQTIFKNNGEVMIYGAVVVAVFNVLNWTLGIFMMTGEKSEISIKKILFNPTIIAVVLGFLTFIIAKKPLLEYFGEKGTVFDIASKVNWSFNVIGDMVTPLSLTVIGIRLANVKLRQLFLDSTAYLVCIFKLIVMSILVMLLVKFLPIDVTVKYVIFFLMSMPSATSTALFAEKFNKGGESASIFVLLSTVLCILTIPLMYLVFTNIFGVVI